MALMWHQSRPRSRWSPLALQPVFLLVLGLTAACSFSMGKSGDDLGILGESVERVPFAGRAKTLEYAQGGHSLIVGGCQTGTPRDNVCSTGLVQVLTLNDAGSSKTMMLPEEVTALALSPDGSKWIAGDTDGRLILSTSKQAPEPFHQRGKITALAFSPDGKWVASGSLDQSFPLALVDMATGGVIRVKARFEPVTALAISPDGKTLAAGMTRGGIVLWNFISSKIPQVVAGSGAGSPVLSVTFSSDGERLAYGRQDGKTVIVHLGSGQPLGEYRASSSVNALMFSPDGRWLALGQENGKVLLIDSEKAQERWSKRHVLPISDLAFSPDGTSLAVAVQQNIFLYYLGQRSPESGTPSKADYSDGLRMKGATIQGFPKASSGRLARVMQIAQDEYFWLLPFDRLIVGAVQAMLATIPDTSRKLSAEMSSEKLVLRAADGRSLSLDLRELRRVEGREGLLAAIRMYESAQRFLLTSNPAPVLAAGLEDAAIQGVLAELGPGLRVVPWPDEVQKVSASAGHESHTSSMFPGAEQDGEPMLQGGRVTYFKLTKFSMLTAGQVREWVARRSESRRRAEAAVLDLRDNPGGDLESGLATAKSLVPPGHRIADVIARKNGERIEFRSDGPPNRLRALVVLVNERTAGTAEMLACAIRASGVGILVGTRTAGVDEVYTTFRLSGAKRLRVSTGRFLCPDERSIRWDGQAVDVKVDSTGMVTTIPFGASPTGSSRRPHVESPLGVGFPAKWDQQLRVGADLALCLSRSRSTSPVGLQVSSGNNLPSLLGSCR